MFTKFTRDAKKVTQNNLNWENTLVNFFEMERLPPLRNMTIGMLRKFYKYSINCTNIAPIGTANE